MAVALLHGASTMMRERTMSHTAVRVTVETHAAIGSGAFLPALLAVNTLLLFAIDWTEGIPHWIKAVSMLFLQF
jgi:hypothetical protein